MITLISFGFAYGQPSGTSPEDLVVDCREFKNPHNVAHLRKLTGMDTAVQQWLWQDKQFAARSQQLLKAATDGSKFMIGCYGGRHRSVAMVEMLAGTLHRMGHTVEVRHRELSHNYTLTPAKTFTK